MANGKHLGKIHKVRFGMGGYDDAMFGISFEFRFDGSCGIGDFRGTWLTRSEYAKYSEAEYVAQKLQTYDFIQKIMEDAKAREVGDLAGKPVEIEIENNTLKSWRILTEVL